MPSAMLIGVAALVTYVMFGEFGDGQLAGAHDRHVPAMVGVSSLALIRGDD